jgi:hypothetical protein
MICIAIDPGPRESAVVVWDGGKILHAAFMENEEMRVMVREGALYLRRNLSLSVMNEVDEIEMPVLLIEKVESFGMAVGESVFETVYFSGRLAEAFCRDHDYKVERIGRHAIKVHICHTVRATDSNIRQALIDRFGEPGKKANPGLLFPLKGHTWAAFALAITWMDQHSEDKL